MWLLTAGDKSSSRRGQTRHIAACLASLVRYRARGAVSLSLFRSRGKRLRLLIIDKYTLTGFDEALVCLGVWPILYICFITIGAYSYSYTESVLYSARIT